jgi:hypothetical protein
VGKLDAVGTERVRRLILERLAEFQARADRASELREIARRARRRGAPSGPLRRRGRPTRTDIDRAAMILALAKHNGSVRAAARALGLPRNTLARHAATLPSWMWAYGPGVLEEHARLLHESGVAPAVARMRGYESARQPDAGRSGMLVPPWTVHGRRTWSQIRHGAPTSHRRRYRNAPDAFPVVDCSPAARPRVLDPEQTLYVTESPRKADAAVSAGLACVDFPGIRMLCLDDETWDYIGVWGRDVRIAFDGDAEEKSDVGPRPRQRRSATGAWRP